VADFDPPRPGYRLTGALVGSLILHGLLLGAFLRVPPQTGPAGPEVIRVDFALLPPAPPAARKLRPAPDEPVRKPSPAESVSDPVAEAEPIAEPEPVARPEVLVPPEPVAAARVESPKERFIHPSPPVPRAPALPPEPAESPRADQEPGPAIAGTETVSSGEASSENAPVHTSAGGDEFRADQGHLRSDYMAGLRRRIDRHKRYPVIARRGRQQGVVVLEFVLQPDGSLAGCEVFRSSGYPLLDRAARRAVNNADPFDPLPPGLDHQPLTCRLPLRFELTR